ncbi:hypothetical protein FJT64_027790 [Amphibalanus amphitrite]|uniref:HAUS augmin-like complex subunit 5 n=1 Tax=Amphibalanus amphitrite TaxID=1232801 RepID=A0A6A4VTN2_AMPAM|nr:hypothetical protein FJT64_027790 [Amphibalanus amphitrite]
MPAAAAVAAARTTSHDLHVWLMNEMEYDASGADGGYRTIPSPENLAELCVGELPDVWKYLMEHVYGPHSIHAVKGNLQLCRGRHGKRLVSSPEEKSLQKKKERLTKSLRQVNSSVEHLESEIMKLEEEIISKSSAVLERREACRREQRLAAAHRLHSARCQRELSGTAALTGRLAQLAGERTDGSRPADTHTVCMRQISEATELLAGHIDRCLERAPTADSLARAERSIQATVARHAAADILRSLAGLQQRAGLQLARKLHADTEPPTAGQTSCAPSAGSGDPVTQKIQRSVDELHALHVTWRVTEVTAERETRRLRHQLLQLTEQLASCGHQEEAPVDWPAHLAAAEARGRAAALETAARQLGAEVEALGAARSALEQRYAAIQRNQQLIERNKSHIQLLISLAGDSVALSRQAQQRAAAAAQRQLRPLLSQLEEAQRRAAAQTAAEVDSAGRRLLADIRWVVVDGRPLLSVQLPLYRPPPALLSRRLRCAEAELLELLQALWQQQRADRRAAALRRLRHTLANTAVPADRLEECCRRVQSQTEHERSTLLPQLERLFVNMSQMGAALREARGALHNWTDQPARSAVQQVRHAGHSLRQWEQRYVAALAAGRGPHRPAA